MSPSINESATLAHKVAVVLDRGFSVISVVAITLLVALALLWVIEPAPTQMIYMDIHADALPGGVIEISPKVRFHTHARKVIYRCWLTNDQGAVVFEYPDEEVADPNTIPFKTANQITMPDLVPGQYKLHAQVIYPFNPFKTGNVYLELATVEVK